MNSPFQINGTLFERYSTLFPGYLPHIHQSMLGFFLGWSNEYFPNLDPVGLANESSGIFLSA
jgi:hypothetical protein